MATTFKSWKETFASYAMDNYAMPLSEFDEDDLKSAFENNETAKEYMEWYAEKYDLIHINEF